MEKTHKITAVKEIKQEKPKFADKKEIIFGFHRKLKQIFKFSTISTYLISSKNDPFLCSSNCFLHTGKKILISPIETRKIIKFFHEKISSSKQNSFFFLVVNNHKKIGIINNEDHLRNQITFNYSCDDLLCIALTNQEKKIIGMTIASNWDNQKKTGTHEDLIKHQDKANNLMKEINILLSDSEIHEKIKSIFTEKKQKIKKIPSDKEYLNQRVTELTSLHDTSNELSHCIDYTQMVTIVTKALRNVLAFDACSIFLLGFQPKGEIITNVFVPLSKKSIDQIFATSISTIQLFLSINYKKKEIPTIVNKYYKIDRTKKEKLTSYANIPLIFKKEVIGIVNIFSHLNPAFPRNEMTFLHTMTNQLASNLGRLKLSKKNENSRISSLIQSMNEGVLMFDEKENLKVINPTAKKILNFDKTRSLSNETLKRKLYEMNLLDLYSKVNQNKKEILNHKIGIKDKTFSVNISPVRSSATNKEGTLILFNDISELQKADIIKTEQLNVISRINNVINSITNLDTLLNVILTFFLEVSCSDIGSIQLESNKVFYSRVHANFPDKIRKFYRFKNGTTISDHVYKTKKLFIIENYSNHPTVIQKTKILIDSYLCLPILSNNKVIGIINIVKKKSQGYKNNLQKINFDIQTLSTLTSIASTAIQNSLLYQDKLKQEKLSQEIKVANKIQTKLLPENVPTIQKTEFGAFSVPAQQIGGDYYDFFSLDNNKIGIIIADIVGKGVPAGLFMVTLKSLLYTHIQKYTSPKKALTNINSLLYNDPVIDKFVPTFYAIYNPDKLTLTYCNAGHEPGLYFSGKKFSKLDTLGFPLGALQTISLEEKTIKLSNNDLIVLFTDGIIESRNKANRLYGYTRLKKTLKSYKNETASKITNEIYSSVTTFSKKPQHDDLTLVCLKVNTDFLNKHDNPIETVSIKINSSKKYVKDIRKKTGDICKKIGLSSELIHDIKLAVNEVHANVIEHAYFGSEEGEILFKFEIFKDKLKIIVNDKGQGIDQKTIKGNAKDLDTLEGSGLGLFLISTIMDDIKIKRKQIGTQITLTKYL